MPRLHIPSISSALSPFAAPHESPLATSEPAPASWSRAEFTRQIAPHVSHLHRLAMILARNDSEAADLLQNSLVQAYLHRGTYCARGSLAAWLYGIVRNQHAELVRTRARRRSLLQSALEQFGDLLEDLHPEGHTVVDPETLAIAHEESELVLACLRRVREPYRTVVFLCDVEDLAHDEIGARLGVPVGTVKSRHARGRAELRRVFESIHGPAPGAVAQ